MTFEELLDQAIALRQESGVQTRLDIVTPRGLTPLVGRDEEVALMQRRWDQATTGMGQVVLLQRRGRHWQIPPRTGAERAHYL